MRQVQKFIILILLVNPFQIHKTNIFNKSGLTYFSLRINCDENFLSGSNNLRQVIRINTNGLLKDQLLDDENNINTYDEETRLASNIKDHLFPGLGFSYSEKTDARRKNDSNTNSTLIFR